MKDDHRQGNVMKKAAGFLFVFAVIALMAAGRLSAQQAEVPHVNAEVFNRLVMNPAVPVLIQFDASWCPYCRALQPSLQALAQEKTGMMAVFRVDTDEEPGLTMEYEVKSLPTLVIFKGGKVIGRHDGAPKNDGLRDWVEETIAE
jgi:thioredoxin